MIADHCRARSGSRADGACAMNRAIGSDDGFWVDPYRTAVTDDHPWANLGIRVKINKSQNGKNFFYNG